MPKRGFTNAPFKTRFHVVNIRDLDAQCDAGAEVNAAMLAELGIIRDARLPLKVLAEGTLTKKLTVTATKFSKAAKAAIEAAGGSVVEQPLKKWMRDRSKPTKKQERLAAANAPAATETTEG